MLSFCCPNLDPKNRPPKKWYPFTQVQQWMPNVKLDGSFFWKKRKNGKNHSKSHHLGVSKNRGTPKWMVKIMEKPYQNGWFGGTPIFGNTHLFEHVRVCFLRCNLTLPALQSAQEEHWCPGRKDNFHWAPNGNPLESLKKTRAGVAGCLAVPLFPSHHQNNNLIQYWFLSRKGYRNPKLLKPLQKKN